MKISQLRPNDLTDEQMTALLFENIGDDQQTGDCIFVPGSSKAEKSRLPKALELYQAGRAGKLLFSGGVVWGNNPLPEARRLKNKALKAGIAERDILIEDRSRHTKENVLASMLVLDRAFQLHQLKRILVVTTPYHMRRMYLTLKTYMPHWLDYSLCPAGDGFINADNWFLHEAARAQVESEANKLVSYVKEGMLADDNMTFSS
ncbi:DUF218 domain-containing protein [Evansella caseinilytica]|uniref:DUF218 domain-containing protein n=1 Tax=Evansella caseinilytica TaxID=1503961 RepID=A0A1H3STZ2_9BACI|nr:YdcF family protein [Evansella caseinilytica]SDZ41210.1 DUF218 domain-containing protein [Evansella caseinilytica]